MSTSRPDVPALLGQVRDAAGLRTAVLALWAESADGAQRRWVSRTSGRR
ncbi:hypothetical protein [Nonomuraea sp. NPDC049504]